MASTCPGKLRPLAHYLKIANEHQQRDPVVYYWCMMYVVQTGIKIDQSSPEAKKFLTGCLDTLEQVKKANPDNEAITSEIVGQAHIEEAALKFFTWADTQDRAAHFDKNVVKAFYTAGHLFEVMTVFAELDEEASTRMKYAKWKAANIHNCLKNGETPIPGPKVENDAGGLDLGFGGLTGDGGGAPPAGGSGGGSVGSISPGPPARKASAGSSNEGGPAGGGQSSQNQRKRSSSGESGSGGAGVPKSAPGSKVNYKVVEEAQKHCKFAISALDYEDIKGAVSELTKALEILKK